MTLLEQHKKWMQLRNDWTTIPAPIGGGQGESVDPINREALKWRDALKLIAHFGGKHVLESGVACNGTWCAEQARTALDDNYRAAVLERIKETSR